MFRHQPAIISEFISYKGLYSYLLDLQTFVSDKLPDNGTLVPKHVGGGTCCEVCFVICCTVFNTYPTAFPYGNGMVLHFYQQQESSTTKTVRKVINRGLKTYV